MNKYIKKQTNADIKRGAFLQGFMDPFRQEPYTVTFIAITQGFTIYWMLLSLGTVPYCAMPASIFRIAGPNGNQT